MDIKALIFDIGGTVFDWSTPVVAALARHACFARTDAEGFSLACRARFLEETGRVVRNEVPWQTSDEIFSGVVRELCRELDLAPPEPALVDLECAWRRMPAWPGARSAIAALRTRYVVAPLTILSWPMAVGSSRRSGIDWDGILTCDLLGVYKPDPRCYARAAEVVGYRPDRIAMVAAHPGDLRAAMQAGYGAVYVRPRLEDPGDDYTDTGFSAEFDVVADDFDDLARKLVR